MRRFVFVTVLWLTPMAASAHFEMEADPFAYLVNGHSIHAAYLFEGGHWRMQLGSFSADVPRWLHGNDRFEVDVSGVTFKVDYYTSGQGRGWFFGGDVDRTRARYRLRSSGEKASDVMAGFGPRAGYRFQMNENLFISPWISVRYLFNVDDIEISGQRYDQDRISIFPTVHIGWRF
ncbi:MAG: hypothetical protein LAT61_01170 [Alcanivorax sp.]|nr:hypothetical protein [Alcanivorax sp.]